MPRQLYKSYYCLTCERRTRFFKERIGGGWVALHVILGMCTLGIWILLILPILLLMGSNPTFRHYHCEQCGVKYDKKATRRHEARMPLGSTVR